MLHLLFYLNGKRETRQVNMREMLDIEKVFDAIIFAAQKHKGQVRKGEPDSPYITHPLSVAKTIFAIGGITDTDIIIAAILHDTIEDTDTSSTEIRDNFGKKILALVLEVTDDKSFERIVRKRLQVAHAPHLSPSARILKFGDKIANCHDILHTPPKGWPLERLRNYIQWSADVIYQIRGTNAPLEAAFDQILAKTENHLNFTVQPFETIDEREWSPKYIKSDQQE
jgi:guanosine-3',5'-bis(diphosphate) 3'-pyrophosphohydrolase